MMFVESVIFNGVSSSSVGLAVLATRRPIMPENKDEYIDLPLKSGSHLVKDNSKRDIMVEVDFLLKPTNNVMAAARAVGAWLDTHDRAPLIFSDDPIFTYTGKVTGNVDLEKIVSMGKFTVTWRCLPS